MQIYSNSFCLSQLNYLSWLKYYSILDTILSIEDLLAIKAKTIWYFSRWIYYMPSPHVLSSHYAYTNGRDGDKQKKKEVTGLRKQQRNEF